MPRTVARMRHIPCVHSQGCCLRNFFAFSLCLFFISLLPFVTKGQSLDQFDAKKGFTLGGSLGFNGIGYTASGIEDRRDPFDFYLTGNLNVGLFGYAFPFTFQYSNRKTSYTQPFNAFRFAPSYKWAKLYVGSTSMSFSNYTLAGHQFSGVGVELTPGKWDISAMYGRLKKAVAPSYDSLSRGEPSYKRMGYGAKLGYNDSWGSVSLCLFSAADDKTSLPYLTPDVQLSPMRNTAVGVTVRKPFLKYFYANAEYSFSMLSKEQGQQLRDGSGEPESLVKQATEQYFDAIAVGLGYQNDWFGLQLRYERVAPDYQTLGAYYFTNDMENITVVPMLKLMEGKLNLSGNAGFQRDNLNGLKGADTKRFVGALNASYMPSEKWNFSGSYSNFNSYTRHRLQEDPTFRDELDSLNFYQVSQSLNAGVGYSFGSKEQRQMVMLNLSYQNLSEEQKANPELGGSNVYTGNASYTFSLTPKSLSISIAGNFTQSNSQDMKSLFVGPAANVSKGWYKNVLRASYGVSYSYNTASGGTSSTSSSLSNRLNLAYTPKPKDKKWGRHAASLGVCLMQRFASESTKEYRELTSTLGYTYSF